MRKDNRTEKTVKKKKRRKKHYLLRLLIIAAVCVGLYFLAHIEYFNVDNVVVTGNREISDEEIIKLSGIKTGGNLFDVHPLIAQHKIKKNLYIEDVDVDRKLPNTVEINISERSGKAQFVKGSKYCVTDNDGKVLEISKEEKKVTIVENVTVTDAKLSETISVKETGVYSKAMKLIRTTENNDLYFKKIKISSNNVEAYVYDGLVCKGRYDNVMTAIKSGALKAVVYELYQKGVESGVISVGSNNYCSFTQ